MDKKDYKNQDKTNQKQEPDEIDYKELYEKELQRKKDLEEENEILRKSMDFLKEVKEWI